MSTLCTFNPFSFDYYRYKICTKLYTYQQDIYSGDINKVKIPIKQVELNFIDV